MITRYEAYPWTDMGETSGTGGTDPGGSSGDPLSDATMVARARDGDTRSFEALVRRYQRPIYRLAVRMLSDTGEAEDVTQEVFVTAWRRLPEIHDDKAIRPWLYRIATNRCLNILRSRKPVTPLFEESSRRPARPRPRRRAPKPMNGWLPCGSRSTGSPPSSVPAGC